MLSTKFVYHVKFTMVNTIILFINKARYKKIELYSIVYIYKNPKIKPRKFLVK